MSDDKAQQEPSMEDILASIRRILSEDEAEEKVKAPPPPPEPPIQMAPPPPPPPPPPEPEPMPMPVFMEPEPEPVFDLGLDSEPEDDILELTEDMVLDRPPPVMESPAFDINDFKPDLGDDFDDEPLPRPPPRIMMEEEDDTLLAPPTVDRSTSALSALAQAVARERAIQLGNGGVTLEEMVRQILKPILKDWLDQNLPYMIERIVKKEIEKMVNRSDNY